MADRSTFDAIVDVIADWAPGESAVGAAAAVLDFLGIATEPDYSSTIIDGPAGSEFGLVDEGNNGPRVRFVTSPDTHTDVAAYVQGDGQVQVRTEGLGYSMLIRPSSTNVATIAVEVDR